MVEQRFIFLRERLLGAGIAAAHANRAAAELKSHFQQLADAASARGASLHEARVEAHALLGSDQDIIDRFVSRPELHSWASRRAGVLFTLFPLLCFIALPLLPALIAWAFSAPLTAYLHRIEVPPETSHRIDLGVQLALLWIAPISISAGFAVLAYRQRVALRWPVAGILALCAFVSLINVEFVIRGGVDPGQAGAGIGLSMNSLPGQAARTAAMAALVLTPLWLALRRVRRQGMG
jgi:hypothetical protein